MLIYGALLIPIIGAIILLVFFSKRILWWEFFIPLITCILFISLMKFIIETAQVTSKEYWGSFVSRIEYYEPWDEYISKTCTSTCCCDSKGENCTTTTYDCSYVDYHPAKYVLVNTLGEEILISEQSYNEIKSTLGNESFIELNRNYHSIDGDEYVCKYDGSKEKSIPVTTVHTYENRIKAADQSIFHFKKVDTSTVRKYGLKEYPRIVSQYKMKSLIGYNDEKADARISYSNGLLGHLKQVRIFFLVFKNQPIEAGIYQEWYWQGANMNEFVVCIGTDKNNKITWCRPISWTKNENLKTDIKTYVQGIDSLDLSSIATYVELKVSKSFKRRDFNEFSYLTVEPPFWALILTYLLTTAITVLTCHWAVENEFREWDEKLYFQFK